MSLQSTTDQFLRKEHSEVISCTITSVSDKGMAELGYAKFKQALYPVSTIIIYEYNLRYYYPLIMEFRLIDNNILYLTEELGITSAAEMFRILTSSMNKEEKWSNEFTLAVIHVTTMPRYCFELSQEFNIDDVAQEHIYE